MKRSPAWIMALAPVAGLLMATVKAPAQWGPSPYQSAGYAVQQAYYTPYAMDPGGPPPGPYGGNGALAGYNAPLVIYDPSVMPAAFADCPACGGAGCDACGGDGAAAGLLQSGPGAVGCGAAGCGMGDCACGTPFGIGCNNGQGIWTKHGPQGTAGCCTPRWWDIQGEFMYLTREEVSRTVNFTSQGQGPGAPIVLSTNDLSFNEAPGMRLMGAILLGPGSNLEGGYFGLFEWDTSAVVASANNDLFSAIGDFGQAAPQPNLPELINSNFQSIHYQTELHNWELNYRRRWVSPNCRFHTSWLAGVRYLVLNEDLNYHINREDPIGAPGRVVGNVDNTVSIFNDVVGFQTGGDLLLCVIPRVKVGANLKAGVYGVRAENHTVIEITRLTGPPPAPGLQTFDELAGKEDVAFVGEGGIEGIFEATERVTLRAGYQLLYVDGIALATENFNTDPFLTTREPVLNDNGDVFYHGFQAGFEFTW